jgi:ribosomal protein S18 acetylase RimI-like enzyme
MQITDQWEKIDFNKIVQLYESVEWFAYAENPAELKKAFENSSLILIATENNDVIGALRSLSDDVSIHYLQDILVRPDCQRKGIAKQMLQMALKRYNHVRTHLLLTDDEEKQHKFYESLGYKNVKTFTTPSLNNFLKFRQA